MQQFEMQRGRVEAASRTRLLPPGELGRHRSTQLALLESLHVLIARSDSESVRVDVSEKNEEDTGAKEGSGLGRRTSLSSSIPRFSLNSALCSFD